MPNICKKDVLWVKLRQCFSPSPWGVMCTHRRTRWALEPRETTVAFHASVALLASLTLVTTRALGSLGKKRGEDVRRKLPPCWGCAFHLRTG